MIGSAFEEGGITLLIDFQESADVPEDLREVERLIHGNTADVSAGVLQRNPESGGPRLTFKFHPGDAGLVEFRAQLRLNGAPLSEVWMYR